MATKVLLPSKVIRINSFALIGLCHKIFYCQMKEFHSPVRKKDYIKMTPHSIASVYTGLMALSSSYSSWLTFKFKIIFQYFFKAHRKSGVWDTTARIDTEITYIPVEPAEVGTWIVSWKWWISWIRLQKKQRRYGRKVLFVCELRPNPQLHNVLRA